MVGKKVLYAVSKTQDYWAIIKETKKDGTSIIELIGGAQDGELIVGVRQDVSGRPGTWRNPK